jgi:hypothetical protein
VTETINRFAPHLSIIDVSLNRIPQGVEIGIVFTLTADKGEQESRTVIVPKTFVANG